MDTEKAIIHTLKDLGVPCHIRGYQYIKHALFLILENRDYLFSVTKFLYPTIAKLYQATPTQVERSIRHAIENTFNNIQPDIQEKYFGNSVSFTKGKPCNSLFLATIAEYIEYMEV